MVTKRRFIRLLLSLLIVMAIFWKPIFEFGAGLVIRALLARNDWHLSYEELRWDGEEFLFIRPQVVAPDIFKLEAERVTLSLKKKAIAIDAPLLVMQQWKFDDAWPDWKITMKQGILEEERIGRVGFYMERVRLDQIARVIFDRGESQFTLEALRENEATRLIASWKGLPLTELNQWIEMGQFSDGKSDGSGAILFANGKNQAKAHLTLDDAAIAFGPWKGEKIRAECDWNGPLAFSPDVGFRFDLTHALCQLGETAFQITAGSMSSFPQIGAKIELESDFPWKFQLRTGFGKEAWIDGAIDFKNGAKVELAQQSWECSSIGPEEAKFLQSMIAPFFPEVLLWSFEKGKISGEGSDLSIEALYAENVRISHDNWALEVASFRADRNDFSISDGSFETPFIKGSHWRGNKKELLGQIGELEGKISLTEGNLAEVRVGKGRALVRMDWETDRLLFRVEEGEFSPLKLEKLTMELTAQNEEIHCYDLRGNLADLPFHVPHFAIRGNLWAFDLRLEGPSWDLLRLWGTAEGGSIHFDPVKSHILGAPIQVTSCILDWEGLKSLHLEGEVPLQRVELAAKILREKGLFPHSWDLDPLKGEAEIAIHYEKEGGSSIHVSGERVLWGEKPLDLGLSCSKNGPRWNIDRCQAGDFEIAGGFAAEGSSLQIYDGFYKSPWLEARLKGEIEPAMSGSAHISNVEVDFRLPSRRLGALFKGDGKLEWERIDLNLSASDLKVGEEVLENRGAIQIGYSAEEGLLVRGLDLESSRGRWKVGLLRYDPMRDLWIMNHSQIRFPPDIFSFFGAPFPIPMKQSIEMVADIECASDLSRFSCKVKEGFFPVGGALRHVRDLQIAVQGKEAEGNFQWVHEGRAIPVHLDAKWEGETVGTVIIRDEELPRALVVDWGLGSAGDLSLHRIDGCFQGIEASFYREPSGGLIGSARCDFSLLDEILPEAVGEKLREFQIGAGYELKGRFTLNQWIPSFQGILTGKEIELFGYRFKTLFAQLELEMDRVKVTDFKISDSAGILQIGKFLALHKESGPWSIEVPSLLVQELRPSLLQKIGESLGPMTPLIVRELKVIDLKGQVGDKMSFSSHGELTFINSYRRTHTMFDLPSDLIGTLVGLDQELIIPACGKLKYEMREGRVHLTSLDDSFSQGKRSQFFLVQNEESPYLDLDGRLHILVKMKQFVLFKFTEFFLISIGGDVSDPEFRLQKKKGFFGL